MINCLCRDATPVGYAVVSISFYLISILGSGLCAAEPHASARLIPIPRFKSKISIQAEQQQQLSTAQENVRGNPLDLFSFPIS